jgi:hypothetical protein
VGGFFFEFEPSCRTQAARLQDEEDSQFEIINKLESECRRHRDKAEKAKKEASRIDGEKGSAEAEKRRGEAEVRSRRPVVLWCLHFLNTTRVHLTMKWVVSFSILRPFGPFPVNTMLRAGVRFAGRASRRQGRLG